MFHVESHPSPETWPPSSHCSGEVVIPSPHTTEHTLGPVPLAIVHSQPASILQLASQPSSSSVLSSSHLVGSVLCSIPSPHISVQVSGVVNVPPEHVQPSSTSHMSLHPSSLFRLVSSHCSPASLCPLPQVLNSTDY